MNDNPVGTPNPLQPKPLDAKPTQPIESNPPVRPVQQATPTPPVQPPRPVGPTPSASPVRPMRPAQPVPEPIQPNPRPVQPTVEPIIEELPASGVSVPSLDPTGRPMEKAVQTEAPKKKKTGLIVGLIVCLFAAVGCGVAAALFFFNKTSDPVSLALNNLVSNGVPKNVSVQGNIKIESINPDFPISSIEIDLDSAIKTDPMANASEAEVTLITTDNDEISLNVSEIYVEDSDLYLKIESGDAELLEDDALVETENTTVIDDCVVDDSGVDNCIDPTINDPINDTSDLAKSINQYIDLLDGGWIRIPYSEYKESIDGYAQCSAEEIEEMLATKDKFVDLYSQNPFISSSTNNIPISNKLNPVRQIVIDSDKLANFANSFADLLEDDTYDCISYAFEGEKVTTEEVTELVNKIPAIYVEVNDKNQFTRFYTTLPVKESGLTFTFDLSFSYPNAIEVIEPEEYTEWEDFLQEIQKEFVTAQGATLPATQ